MTVWIFILPVLLIWVCETALFQWNDPTKKKLKFFFLLYRQFIGLTFGHLISVSITLFLMRTVGMLSPYFIEICKPNVNCTQPENKYKFIMEYVCTRNDKELLYGARSSFPSFGCLQAVRAAVQLILYIEAKITFEYINLLKRLIQSFIFLLANMLCAIIIRDNSSHWYDVLAGYILGILFGYFAAFYLMGWFDSEEKYSRSSDSLKSDLQIPSSTTVATKID
ncbi:phospholipid phosphatase 3-like isoform X2 [Cimex lectularius]|nr:phospholipid phosphatase 3-like isoform X2 [Cimex lectularius]